MVSIEYWWGQRIEIDDVFVSSVRHVERADSRFLFLLFTVFGQTNQIELCTGFYTQFCACIDE